MKTSAAVVSAFAIIALVTPCAAQSVPADLRTAMQQRNVAVPRADAATWDRLTADDFALVTVDGRLMTKAVRLAQLRTLKPDTTTPKLEQETVQMHGNAAIQRYRSGSIWVTLVWAKGSRGWQVSNAQLTPIEADSASVRGAVDAGNARVTEAFIRGDATAVASEYATDAVILQSNKPALEGAAAIRQDFSQFFSGMSVLAVKLTTHDILITEDVAIERGTYEITIHPKTGTGADIIDKGKYLTVWEQQPDGSWKIIRDISNTDRPASM